MEAKRGKKRALDESQSDGEMMGKEKARRGSQRGGEEEEEMVEGLARAVQGQGPAARTVLPPPPVKRVGKSRAASSDLFLNTTRCLNSFFIWAWCYCCMFDFPSGPRWFPPLLPALLPDLHLLVLLFQMNWSCQARQVVILRGDIL